MSRRLKRHCILVLIIYTAQIASSFSQKLHLKIEGSNTTESRILDSIGHKNKFDDLSSLLDEKDAFQKKIVKLGYIENKETGTDKLNDSTFLVRYSLNTLYKSIDIYYNKDTISRNLIESVSEEVHTNHFSIDFNKVEDKLNYLNQQLAARGTPFRTLQLRNIEKKNNDILQAELYISSEKERSIDKIVLMGYKKFPKSYLKRYLKIQKTQSFNLSEISKKTENLQDLTFASEIKPPEVLFTEDSTTLYLYMDKRPSNTFDGFLGFGTNESSNKIEFDGYLNLNLINNLNYGESLKLLYKSDENDQKTFQGSIDMPYILGSAIGVQLQLNIFKKDSSFTTTNQFSKIYYQINTKSRLLLGLTSLRSSDLLENNTALVNDFNSLFYTLGYTYVSRNSRDNLFPVNFTFSVEAGTGKRTFENNDLAQTSITYDVFKIFNFNQKNSIYLMSNGSFLFSDTYFFNELSRFGGINSIRGFEENSLFASLYSLINSEYRYKLSPSLYINSIMDAAYFENKLSDTKEKLFGFGFGLGILTKSGLFKLNYANGKKENQKFRFSDSKIHLSLTTSF